jgi:hypothetical protein
MSALDLDALEREFARRIVDHEYLDMDDIRPLITRLRAAEVALTDAHQAGYAECMEGQTELIATQVRIAREQERSAAEARTAPVAVQLFTDQIDADRVALDWTAGVPAESMPDRSTWRLEQGLGRVTATWSTRDGRRALTRLAVIVRDDFNHSVLVTVDTGPERAEARTAWQPIETAPGAWVVGRRVDKPPVVVLVMGRGLLGHPPRFVDEHGVVQRITAWAPLPAAPEAP